MSKSLQIVLGIVIFVILTIFGGWIFTKFWAWFVLPVFSTLPTVTIGQAIGLEMFILLLRTFKPSEEKVVFSMLLLYTFVLQIIVLTFGWIVFLII